ncbi:MAG: tRNA glutamyl-Q(34) synthetase GluQRS [Solirubrobacteraceae bacterium]|nr:tRNA glutamyl-Q(34) synthetase GluQRS [Patulibacter sp.]
MSAAGRFAPSPSSELHLGNLRTALIAWLAARSQGAPFHLRIDDLDAGRSRPEIAARQLADLAALGLDHDGPVPWQSQRTERYSAAFAALEASGDVYPCFCTRAEIRDASRAPHGAPTAGYPGTCRDLTDAQRAARIASGRVPAWRFRADPAAVAFDDRVLGAQSLPAEDAVLRRADGAFGYQLAVVLDDADQAIGEVVRGADLLGSCATQRQLQDRLDLPHTTYAHVPLMVGADGARLAKRHGASGLADALAGRLDVTLPGLPPGVPATAVQVRSALALTAGLTEPGAQPTLDDLVCTFSYERLPTGSTMMHGCSS